MFTLGGGAVSWRSVKQSSIADFTMEAEYIVASEAEKEAVCMAQEISVGSRSGTFSAVGYYTLL